MCCIGGQVSSDPKMEEQEDEEVGHGHHVIVKDSNRRLMQTIGESKITTI